MFAWKVYQHTFISFNAFAEAVTSSVEVPANSATNTRDDEPDPPPLVALADPLPVVLADAAPEDPPSNRVDWQVERAAPAEHPPLACLTPIIELSTWEGFDGSIY